MRTPLLNRLFDIKKSLIVLMIPCLIACSDDVSKLSTKGQFLFNIGKYSEAINCFNKALEITPENSNIYNFRALTRKKSGDYQGALLDYNAAIRYATHGSEYRNNIAVFYDNRAILKGELNDSEGALRDFKDAQRLNPEYQLTNFNRAGFNITIKDFRSALNDLQNIEEKGWANNFREFYYEKGVVNQELGNNQQALDDFFKYLSISHIENKKNTLVRIGIIYSHFNDYENSRKYLENAETEGAIDLDCYYYLAVSLTLREQHDYKRAIYYYKKVIEINPTMEEAWGNIGFIYEELGKKNEACFAYRKAIEFGNETITKAKIRQLCVN